jgi:hypothetical protein
VGDAALYGAEPAALLTLLFPNLAQPRADSAELLENQIRRLVGHNVARASL